MKVKLFLLLVCFSIISGCGYYRTITATVVDAETMQPIDGAVVMVEWVKNVGGLGLPSHKSFKVVEAVTDKNGKATIEGLFDSSVQPPDVAVYKPGYVTWSSRAIFPSHKRREDFIWGDYTFKLERFKPEYSYVEHNSFFSSATNSTMGRKKLIKQLFDEWEKDKYLNESRTKNTNGEH